MGERYFVMLFKILEVITKLSQNFGSNFHRILEVIFHKKILCIIFYMFVIYRYKFLFAIKKKNKTLKLLLICPMMEWLCKSCFATIAVSKTGSGSHTS